MAPLNIFHVVSAPSLSHCVTLPPFTSTPVFPLSFIIAPRSYWTTLYSPFSFLPSMVPFYFPNTVFTPGYIITSKYSERWSTNKREHAAFVLLDLGHFTQYIFQLHSFTGKFHTFISLYSRIAPTVCMCSVFIIPSSFGVNHRIVFWKCI